MNAPPIRSGRSRFEHRHFVAAVACAATCWFTGCSDAVSSFPPPPPSRHPDTSPSPRAGSLDQPPPGRKLTAADVETSAIGRGTIAEIRRDSRIPEADATASFEAGADSLRVELYGVAERDLYARLGDSLEQAGDLQRLWAARLGLADVLARSSDSDEALAAADRALAIAGRDPARIGWSRYVRAHALLRMGRLQAAADEARGVERLGAHDPRLEASVAGLIGTIEWRGGRCATSLNARKRAVERRRAVPRPWRRSDVQELARSLEESADAWKCVGRPVLAMVAYREALDGFRRARDPWGVARASFAIGRLRPASGDLELVSAALEEARAFLQTGEKDFDDQMLLYNLVAQLYTAAGDGDAGRTALGILGFPDPRKLWPHLRVMSFETEGRLELSVGRSAEAREILKKAVFFADTFGFRRSGASARAALAQAHANLGNGRLALSVADSAVAMADEIGDLDLRLDAYRSRGAALEASGDPRSSSEAYLAAVSLLEQGHRSAAPDVRLGLAARWWSLYEGAIRTLLATGRDATAFEISERARARVLLELLSQPGREAGHAESRASRSTGPGGPSGLEEIRSALLRRGTGLLAYFWGERDVYGWWIDSSTVRGQRLGPSSSNAALLEFLRGALENPSANLDWAAPARRVFRELVDPLAPAVRTTDEWLVIPDGPLAYVPFEVLVPATSEEPLGVTHRLRYGPSASVLALLATRGSMPRSERAMLAVGDPQVADSDGSGFPPGAEPSGAELQAPLPEARSEARALQRMFRDGGADVLTGSEATLGEWLRRRPGRYRYLHFATHARIDGLRPEASHLVLARSRLGLADVRDLRLQAELVTLSACQTALGRQVRGEGILGFPNAFLAAGARGVLVTLWRVDDRATARFMKAFYREIESGSSPAEALRRIRRDHARSEGLLSHPSRWAPFVLIGSVTESERQEG